MSDVEKILERLRVDVAEGLPEASYRVEEGHDMYPDAAWWDSGCEAAVFVDADASMWINAPCEPWRVDCEEIYLLMRMLLCAVDELEQRRNTHE